MNKQNGKRKGGRAAKYPWQEWFRQGRVRCKPGVHFTCMPHVFGVQARQAAQKYGVRISVGIDKAGVVTVEVKDENND